MEIVKANGDVIRLSVDEYRQLEKVVEHKTPITQAPVKTGTVTQTTTTQVVHIPRFRSKSKSLYKRWSKSEDKILRQNDSMKILKRLLPQRTKESIYARIKYLRSIGKIKHFLNKSKKKYHTRTKNDKRIPMLNFVNKKAKELKAIYPNATLANLKKEAFNLYRKEKDKAVV